MEPGKVDQTETTSEDFISPSGSVTSNTLIRPEVIAAAIIKISMVHNEPISYKVSNGKISSAWQLGLNLCLLLNY